MKYHFSHILKGSIANQSTFQGLTTLAMDYRPCRALTEATCLINMRDTKVKL